MPVTCSSSTAKSWPTSCPQPAAAEADVVADPKEESHALEGRCALARLSPEATSRPGCGSSGRAGTGGWAVCLYVFLGVCLLGYRI